jgi:hypothetical protein
MAPRPKIPDTSMSESYGPNGGEAGDWVALLCADELPETIDELIALLDCGALIEEEARP